MTKRHLAVTPAVCAALGKTADEIVAMTLGQFFDMAYGRGFDVRQHGWEVCGSDASLAIKMDGEDRPIIHMVHANGEVAAPCGKEE